MEMRTYNIEEREAIFTQVVSEGKIVAEDITVDLDENGRPINCYVLVKDAPPAQDPSYEELLEAYNIATGGGPA